MKKILYSGFHIKQTTVEDLKQRGFAFIAANSAPTGAWSADDAGAFIPLLAEADAYIHGNGKFMNAELLSKAARLKVIVFLGTGYRTFIDVDYCTAQGIKVGYCPGANANAVAEFSVAQLLAAFKNVVLFNNEVKKGVWARRKTPDIFDKTIGFIGFGNIGVRMARMLHLGFGCRILYNATTDKPELNYLLSTRCVGLQDLLAASDAVVISAALNDKTQSLINQDAVAAMKDGCILLNVARAEIIDQEAVLEGLRSGKIATFATDVYHPDPFSPEEAAKHRYLGDDKLILSPHTSYMTDDSFRRMQESTIDTVCRVLSGEESPNIVN
jgi:phosphoglycerate dehydrogenase-like enzyme